jgi:DNA-binding LytR/AlgR family response regulator
VFVTAYDEYAVAAFDNAAADYLLKPVEPARLDQTVARVQERLQANATPTNLRELLAQLAQKQIRQETGYLQWLRVGVGSGAETQQGEVQLVGCDEIVYLRSAHKYTSVFTATDEYLLRTPLSELEQRLDPAKFWRIHRGIIVSANQIMAARRDLRGRYTLTLRSRSETIRASSAYKHLFSQM